MHVKNRIIGRLMTSGLVLALVLAGFTAPTRLRGEVCGVEAVADRKTSPRFEAPLREPPDRSVDALHLRLEVAFDWDRRQVRGKVSHRLRSLRDDLKEVELDAVRIDVSRVVDGEGRTLEHESFEERLVVRLRDPLEYGEEIGLTIEYTCRPTLGVYFREPTPEAPHVPRQLWTQGETQEARHWIPCIDHPVDRLTTEVEVHAPVGLRALSNGRLVEVREAPGGNGRIFHWLQEKPHTTYLIAVVVGDFAELGDRWRNVPLTAYVPRERADDARRSFELTADMMEFLSSRLGHGYPWARYDQVCVHEFLFGGMENTTLTTLTERTLHDERGALDIDSTGLVAHELAHQWFGDLVTCRDWAHLWINESFATYLANEYRGHRLGRDEEVWGRKGQADAYLAEDRNQYRRPLATRRYRNPEDMFDSHSYPKGARIIAMLEYILGEDAFYRGLAHFLARHQFQSVESEQFRLAMEEATGRSLRWFFEQWVYSGGHPEFHVSSAWDDEAGMLRLTVRQEQELDALTKLFRLPVDVEITTPAGRVSHRIEVSRREETFSFPCAQRPRMVLFDRDAWLLDEVEFPKSREELSYQLERAENVEHRARAAEGLGRLRGDSTARDALLGRLEKEPFWGVRETIVEQLKAFPGETVRRRLIRAFGREPRSDVRQAIVRTLGEFPAPETESLIRSAIDEDPSYYVVAACLPVLGKLVPREAATVLFDALDRPSHADVIRAAAMRTLGTLESGGDLEESQRRRALDRLIDFAGRGNRISTRSAAMAVLARIGKQNDRVYGALVEAVDDPFYRTRMAAIEALGSLDDPRAVAILAARREKESPRPFRNPQDAIDRAIERIERRESADDLQSEVDRLRRMQERLERRIEEVEKRNGARV